MLMNDYECVKQLLEYVKSVVHKDLFGFFYLLF